MRRVVRVAAPEMFRLGGSLRCSAEASFRELDDVFVQDQTRIWLGEVLQMRLNEEMAIADLISDGELLFQVSKVVWKMLLKKQVDLKDSRLHIYERTSSGKSNGRYLPYPKVDSFLKICQILGLTGIDLFSPSDVVEKRNTRKVCMCIRSLSKKARSKNLDVPDFDHVTYTIAMPNDLVDGIRRNLEQSQYSSSSSSLCNSPCMIPREIYRQKDFGGGHARFYDSYSESDETESTFVEFELQSSLSNSSFGGSNLSTVDGDISSDGSSVFDGNLFELQQVLFGSPSHNKLPLPCSEYQINVSEAEVDSNYCRHNKFSFPKIDRFRIEPCKFKFGVSAIEDDTTVDEEAENTDLYETDRDEDGALLAPRKNRMSVEVDSVDRSSTTETESPLVFDLSSLNHLTCAPRNGSHDILQFSGSDYPLQQVLNASYDTISTRGNDIITINELDRDNEAHELDIRRLSTPVDSNRVCTDGSNVPDGTKSLVIHNINPEALCHWASETQGGEKNNDLQEPKMKYVSTSYSTGEEEEEAAGGLRRSVNMVLKSVAGGITVVGVMFLILQLRQRKGQERNIKPTMPLQTPRSSQKRAEIGNTTDRVYPGDRLKF